MSSLPIRSVRLSAAGIQGAPSRVRTQFNTLVSKLESERKRLAGWHDTMPKLQARATVELNPLTQQFCVRKRELIFLFDRAWHDKLIKKKEREKLSDLIYNLGQALLSHGADEELEALVDTHSGMDQDLDEDSDFAAFKAIFGGPLEVDEAAAPDVGPGPGPDDDAAHAPPKKRLSAKAAAREASQTAEELRLKQSVRDIFRKLASSLHPDRETDPIERARKTVLMQRVNVAYGNNDLLALLELQFEIDQIDEAALGTLDEDRIKQYNKVLTRQVAQVRREIEELEHWLIYTMQLSTRGRITPASMEKTLNADIVQARENLNVIEADLRDFGDIKAIKAFLKTYPIIDLGAFCEDDFF
ncbi:MAG: hypothetical protein V4484_22210 [Pseudomonadota bacterium]